MAHKREQKQKQKPLRVREPIAQYFLRKQPSPMRVEVDRSRHQSGGRRTLRDARGTGRYSTTNCTRRFLVRADSEVLSSRGFDSP